VFIDKRRRQQGFPTEEDEEPARDRREAGEHWLRRRAERENSTRISSCKGTQTHAARCDAMHDAEADTISISALSRRVVPFLAIEVSTHDAPLQLHLQDKRILLSSLS
jgi:hypothetical protein